MAVDAATVRAAVETQLGLPTDSLVSRKEELMAIINAELQQSSCRE